VALSPSIPTSFVPKQPVSTGKRRYTTGNNLFLLASLGILGITVVLAGGVFFYSQYLTGVQNAKATQLIAAQNSVSPDTLAQFIRLRDRLVASKTLISQHIMLSQFFTLLEGITIQNVHFSTLQISVAQDRSAQVTLQGEARNFNALATESNTFAAQKNLRSAIFSGITIDPKTSAVSFMVVTSLSPDVIVEKVAPLASATISAPPVDTSTPSFQAVSTTTSAVASAVSTTSASTASTTSP
jgi:hypothetical protein